MDTDSRRKIWENIFQLSQAVFRVTHLFPREEVLRRHLRAKITDILYQASQSVIAIRPPVGGFANPPTGGLADLQIRLLAEKQPRYNFPVINHLPLTNALHNFRGLLFSAKSCDFVNEQNFTVLIKECAKIIESLESFQELSIDDLSSRGSPSLSLRGREAVALDDLSLRGTKQSLSLQGVYQQADLPVRQLADLQIHQLAETKQSHQSAIGFFTPNTRQQKLLDYLQKCQDEKLKLKDIAEEFKNVQPRTVRQDLKELCDGGYLTRNGRGAGSYYIFPKNNTS